MSKLNGAELGVSYTLKSLNDVNISSYVANDLLVVDGTGSNITQVDATSFIPPVIGSGAANDIAIFTGSTPVIADSGVSITTLGQSIIQPTNANQSIRLKSVNGAVSVKSDTGSVFLDADQSTGNINLTSASSQIICYNNASISANNGVVIQAGGGAQIQISNTGEISISSSNGAKLELKSNGGSSNWVFDAAGTSGGNLVFPTVAPAASDCYLKIDGTTGLMFWDPVIGP